MSENCRNCGRPPATPLPNVPGIFDPATGCPLLAGWKSESAYWECVDAGAKLHARLQREAAAMRDALERVPLHRDGAPCLEGICIIDEHLRVRAALASGAGKGWLSPREAEELHRRVATLSMVVVAYDAMRAAEKARAAVSGKWVDEARSALPPRLRGRWETLTPVEQAEVVRLVPDVPEQAQREAMRAKEAFNAALDAARASGPGRDFVPAKAVKEVAEVTKIAHAAINHLESAVEIIEQYAEGDLDDENSETREAIKEWREQLARSGK